jgi:hypothetical protein
MLTTEAAFTYAALAFLAGLILGLASCAPECAEPVAQMGTVADA